MEDLLESIQCAIGGIQFSTKFHDKDEFTKEHGETCVQYLYGSRSFYTIPYGGVMCLPKNQWIFELACIHYMKLNSMIPIKYISGISSIIKVKRTSGIIQDACIDSLNGLVYKKTHQDFVLRCNLSENINEEPTKYSEISKNVKLVDIMTLNNINEINVSIPNIMKIFSNNEEIYDYEGDILDIQENSINEIAKLINKFNIINQEQNLKMNLKIWV